MNMFTIKKLLPHVCVLLLTTALAQQARASSYTPSMFSHAVGKESMSPLFVLITLRNGNTGATEETATLAPLLLWALSVEKHLTYDPTSLPELRRIAISEPNRTFVFTSSTVLDRVKRQYTAQQLAEARALIQRLSSDDLKQQIRANDSALHSFYSHRDGDLFQSCEYALAHALLDRGVLVGVGDRSGLLYLP
jgi:hypothetical protein